MDSIDEIAHELPLFCAIVNLVLALLSPLYPHHELLVKSKTIFSNNKKNPNIDGAT